MTGDAGFGMRLSDETALFIVTPPNGDPQLYRFAPNQVTTVDMPAVENLTSFRPVTVFGTLVVLRQADLHQAVPALLVDTVAARAQRLTGNVQHEVRFSDDGQFLRYLVSMVIIIGHLSNAPSLLIKSASSTVSNQTTQFRMYPPIGQAITGFSTASRLMGHASSI